MTSVFGYAGLGPYGASRGGIRQLTMSLADDWGPHGITVNCLAPRMVSHGQNKVMYDDEEWVVVPRRSDPAASGQVSRRDLDGAIVFLASDASAYITGQTLLVDGGISTGWMLSTSEDGIRMMNAECEDKSIAANMNASESSRRGAESGLTQRRQGTQRQSGTERLRLTHRAQTPSVSQPYGRRVGRARRDASGATESYLACVRRLHLPHRAKARPERRRSSAPVFSAYLGVSA